MFVYWILFPLLFGATLAGLGLGIRRLSLPFTPALLLPVGYTAAVTIGAIFTFYGATAKLTGPILLVLAIGGWVAGFPSILSAVRAGALRRQVPWITAGLAGFLAFGATVIASGTPTYTGYNQIVDLSPQMSFAWYLSEHGRDALTSASTPLSFVNNTLSTGYPAGPQSVLGSFPRTFGMDIFSTYQPYLAIIAGCIVLGAYALIRQATPSRIYAAIGAFAAGQASVLIGYGGIGGIKEMTAVAAILATGALLQTTTDLSVKTWRAVLPFTVALAGTYTIFSLTMAPWIAILGLGAFLIIWSQVGFRDALVRGGISFGAFLIVTIPTSVPAKDSLAFADLMTNEVGNLAHPLSRWAASGVWFAEDHRFELLGTARTLSIIFAVIVFALAIVGIVTALRRRAPGLVVLLAASLIGMTFLIIRLGPWIDLKGMVLASPVILIFAVVGLSTVMTNPRREIAIAAWVGVVSLVVVGLVADVQRYGSAQLAPFDRLTELEQIGERYKGTKTTLLPDWDENGGFALRKVGGVQAFNWPYVLSDEYKATNPPPGQTSWDVDQFAPWWTNTFELIVTRRSPGQSRPGRQYEIIEQGKFFDVWKRTQAPATVAHLALPGTGAPEERQKCEDFLAKIPKGGTATIAPALTSPATATFAETNVSPGLSVTAGTAVLTNGASGVAKGLVDVGQRAGLFDIYATTLSRRHDALEVAGKEFRIERDPSAAPRGQYLGRVALKNGPNPVTLSLGGANLYPGSSEAANKAAWIGDVKFVPAASPADSLYPRLLSGPANTLQCPDAVDWVETP